MIAKVKRDATARKYSSEAALSLRSRRSGTKFAVSLLAKSPNCYGWKVFLLYCLDFYIILAHDFEFFYLVNVKIEQRWIEEGVCSIRRGIIDCFIKFLTVYISKMWFLGSE